MVDGLAVVPTADTDHCLMTGLYTQVSQQL